MDFPKIKHRRALASAYSYLHSLSVEERQESYEAFMRLMVTGNPKKSGSIGLINYELSGIRKRQYRDLLSNVVLKYVQENFKLDEPEEVKKSLEFLFGLKTKDHLKVLKKCLSSNFSLDEKLIWLKLLIKEFSFFNDTEDFKGLTTKNKKEILLKYRKVIARVKKANTLSRIEVTNITVAPKGKGGVLLLGIKGVNKDNSNKEVRLPPYLSRMLIQFFTKNTGGFIGGIVPFNKIIPFKNTEEEDKFRKRISTELSGLRKSDEVLKRIVLKGNKIKLEDKKFDLFIIEKNERKNARNTDDDTVDLIYLNWKISPSLTQKALKDWRSKISGK